MAKIKNYQLIVLILIALLSGCTKRVMIRRYYLIEIEPSRYSEIHKYGKPINHTVDVRDFTVDRAYRQTSIVLRSGTHELNYYFYHYWAVRPGLAAADMVYRIIDKSKFFKNCYRGFSYKPDFVIQGNIQQIERVQLKKAVSAHLKGDIELIKPESGDIVLRHYFDRIVGLGSKNSMDSFVSVISNIILEETDNFLKKNEIYFEKASADK